MDHNTYMWLTSIAGLIAALGAAGAAGAATWLLVYARRQAQEMVEQRYAQAQPLVTPLTVPPLRDVANGGAEEFYPQAPNDRPHFRNIGTGPALNVRAVIYGSRPTVPSQVQPERRMVIVEVPLASGEEHDGDGAVGRTMLPGDTTLDGNPEHTLYAPPEPTLGDVMVRDTMRILARYTITCRDIFGRRHMAIFDYDFLHQWHSIGFFLIPKDLEEASRDHHTVVMTVATNPARLAPPSD
jgi:hypothetical protein